MKPHTTKLLGKLVLALALPLASLGQEITYQGRLVDGCCPANGLYDFAFRLYDSPDVGTGNALPVSRPVALTEPGLSVSNGLFTARLKFGEGVFNGERRWLEIPVRTNVVRTDWVTLAPRTELTPTAYAMHAFTASRVTDGSLTASSLGTVSPPSTPGQYLTFNGSGLQWETPRIGGWGFFGNPGSAGSFVGTTDNSPLELRANNKRALRIEGSGAVPNLIGGYNLNSVSSGVIGATISGGGGFFALPGPFGGAFTPLPNQITGNFGSIGGGFANKAADYATVPGGQYNVAGGYSSFAAGSYAKALHDGSFVWADSSSEDFSSTAPNQFLIRATGGVGINNPAPFFPLDVRAPQAVGRFVSTEADYGSVLELKNEVDGASLLGAINFNGPYDDYMGQIAYGVEGFTFRAGGENRMTISEDGAVRVGVLQITGGADIAEPFQISEAHIPKGAVVVIDEEHAGQLKLSSASYDSHVAGIVSGANGINPGLSLHQEGALEGGQNVALTGRVYAQADASESPIKPGDLLTTSSTPGHCMKVTDPSRAQGAIIGKAMSSLPSGKGMVLVLVSLQ